jgi:serine/threonine-protein kinase RsbW
VQLQISLCLPREAETVALVRASITHTLVGLGVEAHCAGDIRLALSEACTNVIQHASSGDDYEVTVQVDAQHCAISVKNTGLGFDAAALTGIMPHDDSPRGRGVAIMHAVMDVADFESSPESGTIVRLVRELTVREGSPLARLGGPTTGPPTRP